jgi:hypothetical protein
LKRQLSPLDLSEEESRSKDATGGGKLIIIRFNSIHVYLRANLTARRPITKLARVYRNKQQKSYSKK